MKKALRIMEAAVTFVSGPVQGLAILILMVLVLVDVATRYVLQNPLSIAEEYGAYLLVAITCLGLAFTWKEKSHVRVELLVTRLPAALQQKLRVLTLLLALTFTLFMIVAGYELVSFSFMFGTRSGSWTRTPIAWPQMTIVIGSVFLFCQMAVEVVREIRKLFS